LVIILHCPDPGMSLLCPIFLVKTNVYSSKCLTLYDITSIAL
jgi:hypothetical protein